MAFRTSDEYRRCWEAVRRLGVLLLQDPLLPNVAALVAGGTVRGSWWSHPGSREIFAVVAQFADHPDLLTTRLVSRKVTFVHRALWPALLAVARAREPWQLRGLPPASLALLRRVDREGEVAPEDAGGRLSARSPGEVTDALLERLLVNYREIHTAAGRHRRLLESWNHWADRTAWSGPAMGPSLGRLRIAEAARTLCREGGGRCRLPWETDAPRGRPGR